MKFNQRKSTQAIIASKGATDLFSKAQTQFKESTKIAESAQAENAAVIQKLQEENEQMTDLVLKNSIATDNIDKFLTAPLSLEKESEAKDEEKDEEKDSSS